MKAAKIYAVSAAACALAAALLFASCGGKKDAGGSGSASSSAFFDSSESGGSKSSSSKSSTAVAVTDLAVVEHEASVRQHVAEISALRGDSNAALESLTAKIVQVLSSRPDMRVVDRTKMDDVMAEIAFQESDWAEETASAVVGRAIAADMRVVLTASGADAIKVDFLDVNTLQTVTAIVTAGTVGSLASTDLGAFEPENGGFTLNGTWYCEGVRKSQTAYAASDLDKITPFGRLRPEKADSDDYSDLLNRKLRKLDTMLIQDNTLVTLTTESGDEIYADAIFSPKDAYTATSGGKEYSTLLIGTIRIREDGGAKLLEGNVYEKDGSIAIHFGSENGDGSGTAYFLMFEP